MKIILQIRWPSDAPAADAADVPRITDRLFNLTRPILEEYDAGNYNLDDVMTALENAGFLNPSPYRRAGVVSLICPAHAYEGAADLVSTVMKSIAGGTESAIIVFTNPDIRIGAEVGMFVAGPQFTLLNVSFDPSKFL